MGEVAVRDPRKGAFPLLYLLQRLTRWVARCLAERSVTIETFR